MTGAARGDTSAYQTTATALTKNDPLVFTDQRVFLLPDDAIGQASSRGTSDRVRFFE